jgi:hypothetical protein
MGAGYQSQYRFSYPQGTFGPAKKAIYGTQILGGLLRGVNLPSLALGSLGSLGEPLKLVYWKIDKSIRR